MVSKALVVGAYQRKCEEIAALPDIDLTVVVPATWAGQRYEPTFVQGYRTLVEPIRFDGNFHLFHLPTLGRIMREVRPEIVHVDEEPYNLATVLATWHARRNGARPVFFTWQNLLRRYPPPFSWFERYIFSRSQHAIAGNGEAVQVLRTKGFRGPATVIPQFGVDPAAFAPDTSGSGRSEQPFTVGYVGRLVPEKGVNHLLEAVARLDVDWRLRLVGDGPMRAVLKTRAATLKIADRLSFAPSVPSTQVPDQLRQLDVLVLPSLTYPNWKEQFGRILTEAMACGVPVVGSNSGEIPAVVGDAGLIVPEGDSAALATALGRLAANPDARRELGQHGRQRVLDRFTQASIARQTVEVYRQVAAL
jgi:glycosyltransferase involved in cell wall biosynthesis